ncbi:BON domain-containing protein [Trinickia terrae]|uniref:BON domain-containing protein n=1 Tax=Trinickia terrae TaxID=2571161 RepID=A0A4U1HP49_9BURK|nr:BON domain-containing protein [Trinickia terrae]TKC83159.1 BON domain-containing protein [Trinickia terrae]
MKAIKAIKLAGGALIVAFSVSAFAQASDTGMASAPAMSAAQPSGKQADRALSKTVRKALAKAKGVSAAGIVVRAKSGAVTLEGTVPDQSQIDKATQVAQGVAGVSSVKNALTVKEEGQ